MVFSSITFLFVYLPITLVVYYLFKPRYRNLVLFIFSLIFYAWGEPIYIFIMLLSTIVDYFNGYNVNKYADNPKKAKGFVIFSIIFNLSLLGFFKYYGFLATNLNLLGLNLPILNLSLPIGISFYTFQTMSYPIDVYRKHGKYQKSIIAFGTYVTMFPQLIAGPIVRYKDIDDQLNSREYTLNRFYSGITKFMAGLAKKVLLANNLGLLWSKVQLVPSSNDSILLAWVGILAFTLQIYFDFSGYSDMAIGLGRMLGFELLENFNYPYISKSITDFWRRWHISLSTWFRDYVYIPLGGNRKGLKRQIINIMIVWLLTGFWHGASWNYVLWGVYYGTLLIIEKVFLLKYLEKVPNFIRHIYTMFFVMMGWVIFSMENLKTMKYFFTLLFGLNGHPFSNAITSFYLRDYLVLLVIGLISALPTVRDFYYNKIEKTKYDYFIPVVVIATLIVCSAYLVDNAYNPFLYFRF